jgi:hypothetical protein
MQTPAADYLPAGIAANASRRSCLSGEMKWLNAALRLVRAHKTPGVWNSKTAGRHKIRNCDAEALQQSEHDRADKGEGHIGRNNAQSADQSHEQPPWFTSLPAVTPKASNPFQSEKVSATVYPGSRQRCAAGDVVKEQ